MREIRYKCFGCGATLGTSITKVYGSEQCPICASSNIVPNSPQDNLPIHQSKYPFVVIQPSPEIKESCQEIKRIRSTLLFISRIKWIYIGIGLLAIGIKAVHWWLNRPR